MTQGVEKLNGKTVYVDGRAVENVLVYPTGSEYSSKNTKSDITDLLGGIADYTLYFPDTYTGDLYGKTVTVNGKECEVLGSPDHVDQKSVFGNWRGCWDMVVRVQRVQGDISKPIRVIASVVTRDNLGYRSVEGRCIYDGLAQVRFSSGTETGEKMRTESNQTYVFVFPWTDDLRDYTTQQLTVQYNDGVYDVISVESISERDDYASIKAVRHV